MRSLQNAINSCLNLRSCPAQVRRSFPLPQSQNGSATRTVSVPLCNEQCTERTPDVDVTVGRERRDRDKVIIEERSRRTGPDVEIRKEERRPGVDIEVGR